MNVISQQKDGRRTRFALGSKLHIIACIGLLSWTLFLCTFIFVPRAVYADKGAKITQVAHTLRSVVKVVPGFGSECSLHFVYFAVLMLLVGACLFTSGQNSFRILLLAVGMVMAFALFTELLQEYLVLGRAAEMQDVAANATGIGAGGLILFSVVTARRACAVFDKQRKS